MRTGRYLARPYDPYLRPGARVRRFTSIAALLLAVPFLLANRNVYAKNSPTEYRVNAAYLFNFLKFVEWPGDAPADPEEKWVIGIVGVSPVVAELALLAEGKIVEGRGLLVKKFRATDDLRACNILFVSASEEKHLPSILIALHGSSVLTVADIDNFIGYRGTVQFVAEGDRVRMAVDVGATARARLKVSSKHLSHAQAVTASARSAHD
jgi:uncharacterized protein DUF4154